MARLDLGVLVLGMIGGLLCFVLAYGHAVWRARRKTARGNAPTHASSLLSAITYTCAALAVAVLILGISSRSLSEVEGLLSGEDLFAVRPRPGLVASYVALGPDVKKGEVLMRFRGPDDGQSSGDAANPEQTRMLELDPEIIRHAQAAEQAYQKSEERERQLTSERDAIEREAAQQRMELASRRFRVAQDQRTTDGDLAQTQANLASERVQRDATKTLVEQKFVARLDLTKKQETVTVLEEHDAQLKGRRELLGQEMTKTRQELGELERIYTHQLRAREDELKAIAAKLEDAHRERERWKAALALDRLRASDQRARQGIVEAPWDGRIGFREPSPASLPGDGGPLLVQYRPDKIFVVVRLDSDMPHSARAGLDSQFRLVATNASPAFSGGRPTLLREAGDFIELRIPCDPPDRVIRQLALGGAVPVRAQLRLPLASAPGLWLVATLFAVALGAVLARRLVTGASPVAEVANQTPAAEVVPFGPLAAAPPILETAANAPSPEDEVEDADDDDAPDAPPDAVDSNRSVGS
jgi:hypothetical protein